MKTSEQIQEQLDKARQKMEELSSGHPDYEHASSVDDALAWVLEESEDKPMDEE